MEVITDALRQAFMPKQKQQQQHEYQNIRSEDRAACHRPLILSFFAIISAAILISTIISLRIVFPGDSLRRPFCSSSSSHEHEHNNNNNNNNNKIKEPLSINFTKNSDHPDLFPGGAFLLTDQETVDYYWMLLFIPSALIFLATLLYLTSGIVVAYHAPTRHGCLNVVENNYCASRRGGVRCLSILNVLVAIVFGLLALFLGPTLLTLGSSCSVPLFWCYEIASWGLVLLYGGTAFFLRRKAALILDESDFAGKNLGVEMLEANTVEFSPDVDRRVTEGFKAWMGPSFLSSDEEEEPEDYKEVPSLSRTNSSRQRLTPEI